MATNLEKQIWTKLAVAQKNQTSPNLVQEEIEALLNEEIALPVSWPPSENENAVPIKNNITGIFNFQLKQKSYKNLTYAEFRYSIKLFDENSDQFKQIYSNIRTTDLGVLFEEFSFNDFDEAIFNEANNLLQGIINLDQLPKFFVKGQGAQNGYYLRYPDQTDSSGKIYAGPSLIKEIRDTYKEENSLDLELASGPFNGSSENLKLDGNPSNITQQPKYKIPLTALKSIVNAFTGFGIFSGDSDYNSISDMVNEGYKTFLIQSLRDDSPTTIRSNFEGQVKNTASIVAFYVAYDYEYAKRERLLTDYDVNIPPEENIAAAEAAALGDLAASGLVGEGGFQQQQEAVNPEDAQRFYEQCVLLATMNDLKKHFNKTIKEEFLNTDGEDDGKEKMHQPLPYQGRFYMVDAPEGKNQRLLNFISSPRGKKANDFLSITPDIQAFLTPKLRLFKVFNLKDEDVQQVEFIFKNTTSANTKLRRLFQDDSKFFRGNGYGIKNFSFSFNGTTPATAKNDITAELTLFFQDFSDFVTEHETTEGTFKFVDLIFYDKKNKNNPTYGYGSSHPDQYSPSYYRIRADVGWNVPEDNPQFDDACRKRGLEPDNIRDVIEKTNRSYYLNMVEHDLNFKKDGTVEIKAQYRGYVESLLKGTDMDALVDAQILADRASRANTMKTALRDCTPGEVARIKRIYAAQELRTIKETRKRFYERLDELGKIHTYDVKYDGGFRVNGYFERQPEGGVVTGSPQVSRDQFNFYYLGDLLYVMLDTMYENTNVAPSIKNKFIIPSIDFEAFFEKSENFSINIAQIPIADRYFEEWWTENVIKEDRRSFPIMFFLRKLLNDLVAEALIDVCLNRDYERSFNFQTTTLNAAGDPLANSAAAKPANGTSFDPVVQLSSDILPFSIPEGTKIKDIMNYITVYPAYSTTLPIGAGDYTEDLENAVYHFNLGQDRGIVNEVKFSKVDMQYIREARYKREGIDGLLQLGAVYTANLQMFGNTLFYPGMQIFINPFGIGGEEFIPNKSTSIANKLGLGGYHLITKVNSSIASGMFKTTVDAQFIYSGDGDSRKIKQGENEPKDDESVETPPSTEQKCAKLVKAVEDDYQNLVATGQITNQANEAALDANAENLAAVADRISEATNGAVNITFEEAQQETQTETQSSIPAPDITFNTGLSAEDLLSQQQQESQNQSLNFLQSLVDTGEAE